MLPVQPTETAHKHVALARMFEALVGVGEPSKRSIGFGVFDPTGTVVDRLLAVLPKTTAPIAPAQAPAAAAAELHDPDRPSP